VQLKEGEILEAQGESAVEGGRDTNKERVQLKEEEIRTKRGCN